MEDKKLNFNQPFLSVRRFSSTVASKKEDTRKNGSSLQTIPPIPSYKPDIKSGPVSNPGNIPFVWEQSPGRPKNGTNTPKHAKEKPPNVPKLPPGRILKPKKEHLDMKPKEINIKKAIKDPLGSISVLPKQEKLTEFEKSKETKKESSCSEKDYDDDDAFMDALDTLSKSESQFYNCSASGVSGFESDIKPSGIFSTDPKTRDFMMGRFLPAAKAMASEVPQHAPRKQQEKLREVKKVVDRDDNKKPQLRYGPNFLQETAYDNEEEDSDNDYDEHGIISSKVCGLLPSFCLKGSFGLLNPVPGMSMRTRLPSPVNRTRPTSPSANFRPARTAIYEHRSLNKPQIANHPEDEIISKSESPEPTNLRKLEGSGLYNRLQHHGSSNTESSQSERRDLNLPKGLLSFKELLADEKKNERDPQSPMAVEKTLYVDTVHKVESPKSNSLSSVKAESNFSENDTSILGIFKTSHITTESLEPDFLEEDKSKLDKKMEPKTGLCEDTNVDQKSDTKLPQNPKYSERSCLELPAPPPLPKSPSDSWLWRTLPSVTSKNASLRSKTKYPSSNRTFIDAKSDKTVLSQYSQGLLLPIPET